MHPRAAEFATGADAEHGLDFETIEVREFLKGAKTAGDAAGAIGCDVSRIASSLVFRAPDLVVVATSGANRVSERKLARVTEMSEGGIETASAGESRETLG